MTSTFLEHNPAAPKGYSERKGRPDAALRPVYITRSRGLVIYGNNANAAAPVNCRPYTDDIYKKRRLLCDSALGILMLDNPVFTQKAVDRVNTGIKNYFVGVGNTPKTISNAKAMVLRDGKYIANPTSFGRFSPNTTTGNQTGNNQFYEQYIRKWITELNCQDIAKIMCLYDIFVKLYCRKEREERMRQNPSWPVSAFSYLESSKNLSLHLGYREVWYDKKNTRGRQARPFAGSTMPGLIPERVSLMPGRLQSMARAGVRNGGKGLSRTDALRSRGIDMFEKNTAILNGAYEAILAQFNLNFSASASGTTSTLLASAHSFAPVLFQNNRQDIEALKQYVMGCVAYLVGSGMHTTHEVFFTAGKVQGLHYNTGKYDSLLPQSFLTSPLYTRWKDEFWDVHTR